MDRVSEPPVYARILSSVYIAPARHSPGAAPARPLDSRHRADSVSGQRSGSRGDTTGAIHLTSAVWFTGGIIGKANRRANCQTADCASKGLDLSVVWGLAGEEGFEPSVP